MTCPRCQRLLVGRTRWCLVHGEFEDFGPVYSETFGEMKQATKRIVADRLAEADDEATQGKLFEMAVAQ